MVANATAMKLAALSTVNNRIILDNDPKGWGKRRITKPGNENNNNMNAAGNHGLNSPRNISMNSMSNLNPQNITMYNEHGQLVHIPAAAAAAALAQQQQQNGSPLLGVVLDPTLLVSSTRLPRSGWYGVYVSTSWWIPCSAVSPS